MKKVIWLFLAISICFLLSCSPQGITKLVKTYPTLVYYEEVKVYQIDDEIPTGAEFLGTVKIINSDYSTKCNFESAVDEACLEARNVGGNAIRIIKHNKPDFWNSCHRVTTEILRIKQ